MKGTKFRFVCVLCHTLDGLEVEAVYAFENQSLCARHAHPSYQKPARPKLTVIQGGKT